MWSASTSFGTDFPAFSPRISRTWRSRPPKEASGTTTPSTSTFVVPNKLILIMGPPFPRHTMTVNVDCRTAPSGGCTAPKMGWSFRTMRPGVDDVPAGLVVSLGHASQNQLDGWWPLGPSLARDGAAAYVGGLTSGGGSHAAHPDHRDARRVRARRRTRGQHHQRRRVRLGGPPATRPCTCAGSLLRA